MGNCFFAMTSVSIIGINAYHGDSSACLVQDGQLIAAAEEERFQRIKHWAGFPGRAIRYCLEAGAITLADVDFICINSDSQANLLKKISYTFKQKPNFSFILDRIKNRQQRNDIEGELAAAFPGSQFTGKVIRVEHHLAHLVSAHCVSPFHNSACVSLDGFGDFSSSAWGTGEGNDIKILGRVYFPHSLGIFYQALTQFLGFPHYGDEYKVMGLAPYGKPCFLDQMRKIVVLRDDGTFQLNLECFFHHCQGVDYTWTGGRPVVGRLFADDLSALLEMPIRQPDEPLTQRHFDLARSVQKMYEETFFHLLQMIHAQTRQTNLTLAGGCAMNSVANGKVYRKTPFTRLYLQPAAGDAGGAIGAAFWQWYQLKAAAHSMTKDSRFAMNHAFWGNSYDLSFIQSLLEQQRKRLVEEGCLVECIENTEILCGKTASAVAEGKVIGWFQGRMEWGPRALGNRSIICDPRRADMKDILNSKIKRRESFRPFAPSVLRHTVAEWFEEEDDVPFMMQVFQIRPEKREQIPAVTHVDGSGRLQTVTNELNSRYFRLISSFYDLTGVPMVLNTSFNENEPVVCSPQEALDCFLRTKMDVLVLGDFFITR
jgi:carbamoyltransferase